MSLRYSADFRRSRLVRSFFRQTTDLIVYVPLFSTDFTRSRVRVLALARNFFEHLRKRTRLKGLLFQFFSALCDCFFDFYCLQRVPPSSFLIFRSRLKCQKAQRVFPFKYFGTMRLFKIFNFRFFLQKKIKKNSIFFVSERSLFKFFDILQKTGFSKTPKGPPFTGLKTLRFLSLRYSDDFRRSRLVRSHSIDYLNVDHFHLKFMTM